jgi:hypothetical protein
MRNMLRLLTAAGLLWTGALARPHPVLADITHIQDHRMCSGSTQGCAGKGPVPVEQGETRTLSVKGQNVNFCSAVSTNANGTVTIVGTKAIADGFGVGTGQIDIRVALTGDAATGARTVTLSNCVGATFTFTVHVVRDGTAAAVNPVPRQSDFFTQVDVTVTGTNIAGAGAKLNLATPPGQVQVVSSNATSATLRLTYSSPQSKVTGQLILFDASFPGACASAQNFGCYGAGIPFTVLGPNAVESITFPTGSTIHAGGIVTIRVRLTQPAPAGSFSPGGGSIGGELVKWQVHPSTAFTAETGTTFNPNVALNDVRLNAGSQSADLVVRFVQNPTGCGPTCTATVEARTSDFRDAPPYKKTVTFTLATP